MNNKSLPSMFQRFKGERGKQQLVDAIRLQQVVSGDKRIAEKLVSAGNLVEFCSGGVVAQQGNTDSDIYFIVCGEVTVEINSRTVAKRSAGQHVGEMALLDRTARRSATVIANEQSIALKLSEKEFTKIANRSPQLWRMLALTLAVRLSERSKFLQSPNEQPIVFIGSSTEALDEAKWLSDSLRKRPLVSNIWSKGVFNPSQTAIEDLMRAASQSDFSVLLLTPDDMTASRGKKKYSPRDNAVFELGLFMGALGRERTFLVTPSGFDLKLPTDLLGMTRLCYSSESDKSVGRRLSGVSRDVWNNVKKLGPK